MKQRRENCKVLRKISSFLILGLLGCCVSCSKTEPLDEELLEIQKVPLVKVVEILPTQSVRRQTFTGSAKEGQTTRISFRVPGPLVEFSVGIGETVSKGTVLARIDPRDFDLMVKQVQAGLAEANAALKAMKTGARSEDLSMLESQLAAASSQLETAAKNEERFAALLEKKSVPQIKYDEMKLHRDQAQAAYNAAQQQLEKGKKGARSEEIEAMEAKIAGLEVQLEKAENALADTVIYAPSDGCVSQKFLENGEIAAPGVPVLVFTDTCTIHVQTTIPESVLLEQANFDSFSCEFEAYPDVSFPAKLHELGQALQNGKPGWPLVVEITSEPEHPIHPGMTGKVTISVRSTEEGVFVPAAALAGTAQTEGEYTGKTRETHVWLVGKSNTVTAKSVSIIRVNENSVEIQGEFQPQDRIVCAGARFLHEGERVRIAK